MALAGRVRRGGLRAAGRHRLVAGALVPWSWTMNVAGAGRQYDCAPEAAMLEETFEPAANVRCAARFPTGLHAGLGGRPSAVNARHSHAPDPAEEYRCRVMQALPMVVPPIPAPPA
ncbi:MAG TPA: hypothetical protein VGC15_10605 [Acetobacteraceae bacterium]